MEVPSTTSTNFPPWPTPVSVSERTRLSAPPLSWTYEHHPLTKLVVTLRSIFALLHPSPPWERCSQLRRFLRQGAGHWDNSELETVVSERCRDSVPPGQSDPPRLHVSVKEIITIFKPIKTYFPGFKCFSFADPQFLPNFSSIFEMHTPQLLFKILRLWPCRF